MPTLEDVILAEGRPIPLFLEKCVRFIEEEGLDSEGIYRVPGNRAHVDILFQKIEEGIVSKCSSVLFFKKKTRFPQIQTTIYASWILL